MCDNNHEHYVSFYDYTDKYDVQLCFAHAVQAAMAGRKVMPEVLEYEPPECGVCELNAMEGNNGTTS